MVSFKLLSRGRSSKSSGMFALVLATLVLAACGRAATEEECRAIFDKNVEIQLKSMDKADPSTLDAKKKEYQASFEKELKACVGKRITESLLTCIKSAQTEEQLARCGH